MELWVFITIAAAFFQNIRSTVQKYLKGTLSTSSATFVRFGFGVPFAVFYWILAIAVTGSEYPGVTSQFWFWVSVAAVAQIIATFLLLKTFAFRNFAVGTAYSRTEPAQTALFALILFGEKLSAGGMVAIAVSIVGVMIISVARTAITFQSVLKSVFSEVAAIGLASGTLFGLAAVGYRAAALAVEHDVFFIQSATTLVFAIVLQTLIMVVWIALQEREQFPLIAKAAKPALLVGFVGATASFGWFTAFTLQQAALVKVVAQVEMLFTFASAIFFFKEKINRPEVIGCVLITAGIVMLLIWN
ncbi:MAG: DMT family transporter [Pseudomonadota bacterium]